MSIAVGYSRSNWLVLGGVSNWTVLGQIDELHQAGQPLCCVLSAQCYSKHSLAQLHEVSNIVVFWRWQQDHVPP